MGSEGWLGCGSGRMPGAIERDVDSRDVTEVKSSWLNREGSGGQSLGLWGFSAHCSQVEQVVAALGEVKAWSMRGAPSEWLHTAGAGRAPLAPRNQSLAVRPPRSAAQSGTKCRIVGLGFISLICH